MNSITMNQGMLPIIVLILSTCTQAFTHNPGIQRHFDSKFNSDTSATKLQISSPFLQKYHHHNSDYKTSLNLREKTNWFEENPVNDDDKEEIPAQGTHHLRFLGKGKRAIVRPGVVLIAPNHEYHHFLMKSAIFIHAIGLNEYGDHVTRGVIIDHPTAFTMGEMSAGSVVGVLGNNILFQGGDQGNDSAIMLHSLGNNENTPIGCGTMIGTSGIYEGGLNAALDAADEGEADPDSFKFFFNHVEFTDKDLESMLESEDSDGDAWISVEAPVKMILDSDLDRGDAWRSLRNQLKQMTM